MFIAFEKALVSGEYTVTNGKADGQNLRIRDAVIVRNRIQQPAKAVEVLQTGDKLQRTWSCNKPDCYRSLGMDKWDYHENIAKVSDNEISVEHTLVWHEGKSRAIQRYVVRNVDDNVIKETGKWTVSMGGLSWPIRSIVESAMRKNMTTKS